MLEIKKEICNIILGIVPFIYPTEKFNENYRRKCEAPKLIPVLFVKFASLLKFALPFTSELPILQKKKKKKKKKN